MDATALSLPLLIGAAVIDSINPCAFGVLIFLIAYLSKTAKSKGQMLLHGFVYIAAVFITYLVAGLLLLPIIRNLGNFSTTAYLVIAGLIILAGLIELKDVFWYGKGPSLSIFPSAAKRIELYVARVSEKLITSFLLGVFVAIVELPCTGAVYLAVLTLMALSGFNLGHFVTLLLYNLIFILPLIVILLAASSGMATERMEAWRNKHKKWMRLGAGLLLIGLGIWMILFIF